jgi:CHAD domain-containing protein
MLCALSKHLPRAVEGEIEPLHQARVATRRLREILPLCACEVPRGLANRALRQVGRVGRALGDVREIDVSIDMVEEIIQTGTVDSAAGRRLQQYLQDEREQRRERMLDRLSSVSSRKLERDLADVARVLGMRQQTDEWAQMLAVRIERRSEGAQRAVGEAGVLYISDRVHRVRIATKKLRYALELAGDTGEAQTREAVRSLKEIQDVLGRLHDLEVLGGMIQDLTMPTSDAPPANAELEACRLALADECRGLHSQYVGQRESFLRICQDAMAWATLIWTERGGASSRPVPPRMAGRVLRVTIPVPESAKPKIAD